MDDRRHRRLAELRAEEAAEKSRTKEATDVRLSNDAEGIRGRIEALASKDLPDRAEKLARAENLEYGDAVRKIIAEDDAFHHLPGGGSASGNDGGLEQIVAERMAADPEGYRND